MEIIFFVPMIVSLNLSVNLLFLIIHMLVCRKRVRIYLNFSESITMLGTCKRTAALKQ